MPEIQRIYVDQVIQAALSLVASRLWSDNNPGDAHAGDQIEDHEDQLDAAVQEYANARGWVG